MGNKTLSYFKCMVPELISSYEPFYKYVFEEHKNQ